MSGTSGLGPGVLFEDETEVCGGAALSGRPNLGLSASTASSLIKAGLRSDHALNSVRFSPDLVTPTLISTVLLEGRETIKNGPL